MDRVTQIAQSDYILTFGSFLASDNIEIQEAIIEAIAKNSAEFIYMHPIDNVDLKVYYSQFIKYEVGSEEGVASLLLDSLISQPDERTQLYMDDLDIGYISAESSAGEEEFEEACERMEGKSKKTLVVGRDVFTHERVDNIVKMLHLIQKYSDIEVIALEDEHQALIDSATTALDEVEELASYNGTVLYRVYGEDKNDCLVGSESFARIAKVSNNDTIVINSGEDKIQRTFVIDKNLYGTIALCAVSNEDTSSLSQGYRYKQVKIEKVDA